MTMCDFQGQIKKEKKNVASALLSLGSLRAKELQQPSRDAKMEMN